MSGTKRVTISLDSDLSKALTNVSQHLKVSKSAFVNEMLRGVVLEMSEIMDSVPKEPKRADIIRARGKSALMVKDRVAEFQDVMKGFDDLLEANK